MPAFIKKMFIEQLENPVDTTAAEALPCDTWGNIKAAPERIIEETHGKNFIKILIFEVDGAFYFGYQFRISRLIRGKTANINGQSYETPGSAITAARKELKGIIFKTKSRGLKMLFANFVKLYYNQPELF
jgi:hypothetical protein